MIWNNLLLIAYQLTQHKKAKVSYCDGNIE